MGGAEPSRTRFGVTGTVGSTAAAIMMRHAAVAAGVVRATAGRECGRGAVCMAGAPSESSSQASSDSSASTSSSSAPPQRNAKLASTPICIGTTAVHGRPARKSVMMRSADRRSFSCAVRAAASRE
jgi:hypothetical protein